jgi:hypothetical protein
LLDHNSIVVEIRQVREEGVDGWVEMQKFFNHSFKYIRKQGGMLKFKFQTHSFRYSAVHLSIRHDRIGMPCTPRNERRVKSVAWIDIND